MHLVVRSAIVFARIGLYISLSADDCLARGGCFIIDRLIDVMWFVLSILSSTWLSRVKSASDRSKVVKFLERSVSVAMSALFPPNPWSPKYVNLGALRIRWFSISISSQGFALHTQSGITKEVVWALRMFSMTGFVIRWPRIVMFFHSFVVRVISLKRWFVLWTLMRFLKERYASIRSRISAGMLDNPFWLSLGISAIFSSVANWTLYLASFLGVAASGWIRPWDPEWVLLGVYYPEKVGCGCSPSQCFLRSDLWFVGCVPWVVGPYPYHSKNVFEHFVGCPFGWL